MHPEEGLTEASEKIRAEEHRRFVRAETANRRELLRQQINDIAAKLHCRGLYPSVERIVGSERETVRPPAEMGVLILGDSG